MPDKYEKLKQPKVGAEDLVDNLIAKDNFPQRLDIPLEKYLNRLSLFIQNYHIGLKGTPELGPNAWAINAFNIMVGGILGARQIPVVDLGQSAESFFVTLETDKTGEIGRRLLSLPNFGQGSLRLLRHLSAELLKKTRETAES